MRSYCFGIGLLLFGSIAMNGAAEEAGFVTENIFPYVSKHVHGSSIVECPNGDLLVAWFHGSGERTADDVVVNGARKKAGSDSWSPIFLMADTPGFPDCNPVLFIDSQERLWLFWIAVQAHRWECSLLKYRRSEDYQGEGAPVWNWQDVILLKPGDAFQECLKTQFKELGMDQGMWGEYAPLYTEMLVDAAADPYKRQVGWMTRIHPTVLPSGRILLPLYSDGFNISLAAISDDLGETWRASLPMVGAGPTQPTIVRKKNGDLVAYMRDSGERPGRVLLSTSTDEGGSWSPSVDGKIPNPDSSLEIIPLKDGRWLYIGNDTAIGRGRLSALLSEDEGASWSERWKLEPSDIGGNNFSYPSVVQGRDGMVHMSYSVRTAEGASIRHGVLDPGTL